MKQIKVGLVGVTGYTGMELARLMENHPSMTLACVTSRSEAGQPLCAIYPFLQDMKAGDIIISQPEPELLASRCDLVFLAVPHGAAMEMAAALRAKNLKVVDLSADFRLRDASVFKQWYKADHTQTECLAEAVYGLPELHAADIAKASLVANPGCYPTASILGLAPALRRGFIKTDGIVIDAKSGVSGAGRGANIGSLFCEVSDTFKAYNLTKHRHTPEIEQELSLVAGRDIILSFNPHLLPVNRGILATMYADLADCHDLDAIHAAYTADYAHNEFVRVLPKGNMPELRYVRGTMYCDIGLAVDMRTQRLIIVSAIDNLCRGASGQAIANANLMTGLPLGTGLRFAPMVP